MPGPERTSGYLTSVSVFLDREGPRSLLIILPHNVRSHPPSSTSTSALGGQAHLLLLVTDVDGDLGDTELLKGRGLTIILPGDRLLLVRSPVGRGNGGSDLWC